jgi:ABC-type phosphate transport system substrate-binding protein
MSGSLTGQRMRKIAFFYALSIVAAFMEPRPSAALPPAPKVVSIIAHRSVAISSITRDELRPIFQTRKTTWPDGSSVRPFNLPPSSSARKAFDEVVLGLRTDDMQRYWIDRRIRGGASPPTTVPNETLMLQVVKTLPGAVGYVESVALDPGVKVIARISANQLVKP